jgi:cytochrome c oxidase cbb3-type subunit 3
MAKKPIDKREPETTGHEWDGIQEYNNPLPRWWVWVFYATIVWGIWYVIAYPAWPLIDGATQGYKGWSTRANVAAEIEAAQQANAGINARLTSVELAEIPADEELNTYAVSAGASIFQTWCAQCHGSGAAGVKAGGYPNLLDNAWLWGGTLEDIHYTIAHGIRNEDDPDARWSQMPAFGEILDATEIDQVVNHVMSLSGTPQDAQAARAGEEIYLNNCAVCHGETGGGDTAQGAPALKYTVTNARFGIMPPMGGADLTEAETRAVAVYVHQLGGGK